jgi:hypothetical protein
MRLRTKLTIGLGFLFLIIFALAFYGSYQIQKLSRDADSIIKDNYDSLVYCKNMLLAADDMRATVSSRIFGQGSDRQSPVDLQLFEASKASFESNLRAEQSNITEVHEREYVAELDNDYGLFLNLCLQTIKTGGSSPFYFRDFMPAYQGARQTIVRINDINMDAIERKNQSTRNSSSAMVSSMAVVGAVCILLAFLYFWYFPFYISNSISYLARKMKDLLQEMGIRIDLRTGDEALMLLQSINLLENEQKKKKAKR